MPKRNWDDQLDGRRLIAFSIIAAFACLIAWVVYSDIHNTERNNAASAQQNDNIIKCVSSLGFTRLAECILKTAQSPYEETKDWYDLKAQQDMAKWALLMFIVTGVGVVYVALTLLAARHANEGFALSAERQDRAYLSATPSQFSLKTDFSKNQPYPVDVSFRVVVKNHGQTPAHNVKVWANIALEQWPVTEEYVNSFAEKLTQNAVINPGEERTFNFEKAVDFHSDKLWTTPPHTFVLLGIVRYDSIGGPKFSRFCGGLSGLKEWYLHARNGVVKSVDITAAQHSNDAN